MAILANRQSGNFTDASTWGIVSPIGFLNSALNATATTTSYVESQSFTPGAITIDAIAVRLAGSNGNGTFSARLAQAGVTVAGTEVTINLTDINANTVGFVLFKLAAPVTLAAATAYTVSVRSSVAGSVSVFRDGTVGNWSRMLRTTTTAAPAATDSLFILGEHLSPGVNSTLTVTMNNTAASIFALLDTNEKGILDAATAPSTNYQLIVNNNINIRPNSTIQIGTSGTPMPQSSSFVLQLNQSGVNVNFGIIIVNNAIFRTFGAAKTNRAFLAANAPLTATTITTDIATNWLAGEEVVIASTTTTNTQQEVRTLSANAVGATLTVPALTFSHNGTGDFVAEIANITRNIKIRSDSASFGTYMLVSAGSTVDLNYTELIGMGSATANRRGIDVLTTTGTLNVIGCSLHRFQASSIALLINQAANANITVSDTVFFNHTLAIQTSAGIAATSVNFTGIWGFNSPFIFAHRNGTMTDMMGTGGSTAFSFAAVLGNATISNITAHSNAAAGVSITTSNFNPQLYSNIKTWRNVRGLTMNATNVTIDNHTSYGNTFSGISITGGVNITLENSIYYGSTSTVQTLGLAVEGLTFNVIVNNCTFGSPTAHTTADMTISNARTQFDGKFNNCLFNSSTELGGQPNLQQNAFIGSSRHDQTAGLHRGWKRTAVLNSDSVIRATAPLSVRITPSVITTKTNSTPKGFAIPSGLTATVSVLVRRSVVGDGTAYNGALPRLWLRQNNSAGITSDVLLATATAASLGAFETLTGSIPAGTDNTVNYVYVDCDGTAGWVNFDRWSLVINGGTANSTNLSFEDYWNDGLPYPGVNTTLTNNTNQETYWIDGAPVAQIYPVSTLQTGRFFLLFE